MTRLKCRALTLYYCLTLCVLEIMTPQWSNLILTTDVPNCETYILVLHSFNVKALNTNERKKYINIHTRNYLFSLSDTDNGKQILSSTDCWDGGNNFSQLQLVQNRRLSSSIKTHHKNPHLFLAKDFKEVCK